MKVLLCKDAYIKKPRSIDINKFMDMIDLLQSRFLVSE
jgi:hypothetical protein